jgi:hypothetical protein
VTYSIEFEIPGLPLMSNNLLRGNWRPRFAHSKKWKREVYHAVHAPMRPAKPLEKAKLTLTRISSVEPDFDGLVSGFKPVVDGLVECGVLFSDKPSCISPEYKWEKGPKGQGKIRVKVEAA